MVKRKKNKDSCWDDIKKPIEQFKKSELVSLIRDLYRLSSDNKDFFHTRFSATDEDTLLRYKKIIQDAIHPYLEDHEPLEIEVANNAIQRFSKAVDDPIGEAELRTFYVECGNNFILSYGVYDDEELHDDLLDMYKSAIRTVLKTPPDKQKSFQKRLKEILKSGSDVGYGYGEVLNELYYRAFSEE